jgi:hypothetical protein
VVKYLLDCRQQPKKEVTDMTTQEKLIKRKQSLLELAEYLQNISQACKINGVFRQHFYDIKKTYEEQGLEGLRERSPRKLCFKKRVAPDIEEAVATLSTRWFKMLQS